MASGNTTVNIYFHIFNFLYKPATRNLTKAETESKSVIFFLILSGRVERVAMDMNLISPFKTNLHLSTAGLCKCVRLFVTMWYESVKR